MQKQQRTWHYMTGTTLHLQSDFMYAHAVLLSTAWRPDRSSAATRARRQMFRNCSAGGFSTAPWYCDHGRRGGFTLRWSPPPPACDGYASNSPVIGKTDTAPCPHGAATPRKLLGRCGSSDLESCRATSPNSRRQETVQPAAWRPSNLSSALRIRVHIRYGA